MVKFYRKSVTLSDLWVSSNDRLSDFYVSSWQRGESAVPMLVVRLVLALLAVAILVWALVESPNPYWLIFLTNWGLLLIASMTLSGLLVSCIAVRKRSIEGEVLPWYMSIYWLTYNTSVPIALMITTLYWILIYNPNAESSDEAFDRRIFWLDVATHGLNSCIVLAEVVISRTPVRLLHVYQPLGLGLWYIVFTAIYYAAGGTDINGNPYIYEVLDWRQGKRTTLVLTASVAGLLILYLFLWGVVTCRDKVSTALVRTTSHDLPHTPPDRHMPTGINWGALRESYFCTPTGSCFRRSGYEHIV